MSRSRKSQPIRIFGTDGIRALAGEYPLTGPSVERIGFSAGTILRRKTGGRSKVIVGKDTRASGDWIEKALSRGLARSGCRVLSCGVVPTSAVSALLRQGDFLGGAVISASHNPAEFNGIKFFSPAGKKIPKLWERQIESGIARRHGAASGRSGSENGSPSSGPGTYPKAESSYMTFLRGTLPDSFSLKGLRWVVDCANGAASKVAPVLLESLGADVTAIHSRPNGRNINLRCGAQHPESLQKEVRRLKAHGGCAFDGDADRVQFVDEKGRLLDGDVLIAMAVRHLKRRRELKKNCVVTTVMANLGFFEVMKKLGVRVVTTPVGDRSVSEALERNGAILGGEQSGHIIFRRWLPTGDGILTAMQILAVMRETEKKLSYFSRTFPKYPQVLYNLKVKKKAPIESCPDLERAIHEGTSRLKGQGRVFVRYSGTEPLLRVMVEGKSLPEIKKIAQGICAVAEKVLA